MLKFYEAKNVGIAITITRLFRQNRLDNIDDENEHLFFYHYIAPRLFWQSSLFNYLCAFFSKEKTPHRT